MKRLLLLLALIPALALAGSWTKNYIEPDELLGEKVGYYKYAYETDGKAFVFRTDKPDQFYIVSDNVLDCQAYQTRVGIIVKVGLYDEGGTMLESFEMFLGALNNHYTVVGTFDCDFMSQPTGQQKKTRKIFKHLRGDGGYVRIICDSYSSGLYDLRVPPIKTE